MRKHEDRLERLTERDLEHAWDNVELDDGWTRGTDTGVGADGKAPFERMSTPNQRLAAALRLCRISLESMTGTAYGYTVAEALLHYLEHGMLLADVHLQNMGHVMRDGVETLVITDPGHSVLMPARLAGSNWL